MGSFNIGVKDCETLMAIANNERKKLKIECNGRLSRAQRGD